MLLASVDVVLYKVKGPEFVPTELLTVVGLSISCREVLHRKVVDRNLCARCV